MEGFLPGILRISMFGSLSAMLLLVLRHIFRRTVSQSVVYYLWLLVLLRLCIPAGVTVTLPSASRISSTDSAVDTQNSGIHAEGENAGMTLIPAKTDGAAAEAALTEPQPQEPLYMFPWVAFWGLGALAHFIWHIRAGLVFSRAVRRSLSDADSARVILRELEPSGRVPVAESSMVDTPMLTGLLHPVIVLPAGMTEQDMLKGIMAHELVHAKRRDLLYKWFVIAVTSLHWFNPLMILIRREIDRCCELSCDEAVIRGMGADERRRYGETLLVMAGAPSSGKGPLTATLCEEKTQLKERLVAIAKYRKKGIPAAALSVLLLIAVGGCAVVSDAKIGRTDSGGTQTGTGDAADQGGAWGWDAAAESTPPAENPGDPENGQELSAENPENPENDQELSAENPENPEEEPERFYEKDGRQYELVRDLNTGGYLWASVVTPGTQVKEDHGLKTDYNSQERYFERLDGDASYAVRRWDNLLYSAGDYLVFEYNGTIHVSKSTDLYHPVLSYDADGTHGIVIKVPQGYVVANDRTCEIRFYNEKFAETKVRTGLRAGESGHYYEDGLMLVRDMQTGQKGFMDEEGELVIPCKYADASDFSNGYASVLTGAEIVPYTEDGGAVQMYYGKGGQWGIIDRKGSFVIKPSKQYANENPDAPDMRDYPVVRGFGPVREDGTVDFIAYDQDERVLETVNVRQ